MYHTHITFMDVPDIKRLNRLVESQPAGLNHVQRAYFAGHFDGEGYVGLARSGQRCFHIQVKVANVYKPVIAEYQKWFGGSISVRAKKGRMLCWNWSLLKRADVQRFIITILPFSKEKKPQLELALAFIKRRLEFPKTSVSEEFRRYGLKCRERITAMKHIEYEN